MCDLAVGHGNAVPMLRQLPAGGRERGSYAHVLRAYRPTARSAALGASRAGLGGPTRPCACAVSRSRSRLCRGPVCDATATRARRVLAPARDRMRAALVYRRTAAAATLYATGRRTQ